VRSPLFGIVIVGIAGDMTARRVFHIDYISSGTRDQRLSINA
jgi:hypothetical protein